MMNRQKLPDRSPRRKRLFMGYGIRIGILGLALPFLGLALPLYSAVQSLDALVSEAIENNPGLKASTYKVNGLHASANHTWFLEAPEIGVEFYQTPTASFPNPIKNQMEIDYSLKQAFPFPGKIASRIDVEHKHAAMGEAESASRLRALILEVKSNYYELVLLDRRVELNRQNHILMNHLVEIARKQYEVGMGRQSDILKAQTETTNLTMDSLSLDQERQARETLLLAILNRKVFSPIIRDEIPEPLEARLNMDQIRPILEKSHPELQFIKADIQMREAEKNMARKEFYPDFMVGGAFKNMLQAPPGAHGSSPENYWSVMATMNIPFAFWSLPKYRAGLTQNEVRLREAEAEYTESKNRVLAKAQIALVKASSNAEVLKLSRDRLLPQAKQTLESTLAAYQGGKGEFMGLLDAYRMLLSAQENYEKTTVQLLISQAELEMAVGLSFPEIEKEISIGEKK